MCLTFIKLNEVKDTYNISPIHIINAWQNNKVILYHFIDNEPCYLCFKQMNCYYIIKNLKLIEKSSHLNILRYENIAVKKSHESLLNYAKELSSPHDDKISKFTKELPIEIHYNDTKERYEHCDYPIRRIASTNEYYLKGTASGYWIAYNSNPYASKNIELNKSKLQFSLKKYTKQETLNTYINNIINKKDHFPLLNTNFNNNIKNLENLTLSPIKSIKILEYQNYLNYQPDISELTFELYFKNDKRLNFDDLFINEKALYNLSGLNNWEIKKIELTEANEANEANKENEENEENEENQNDKIPLYIGLYVTLHTHYKNTKKKATISSVIKQVENESNGKLVLNEDTVKRWLNSHNKGQRRNNKALETLNFILRTHYINSEEKAEEQIASILTNDAKKLDLSYQFDKKDIAEWLRYK